MTKEIITLEQNAFDATNIPSSVSSIKSHLSEAVSIALGGVSVDQFIVDNKIDLSKVAHQRKLTGIATAVSKSKTLFAGLIKEKQEEAAVESKKLLEIRKEFVSFCDSLRDEIQQPVKDYKAEQERKRLEAERALNNIIRYRNSVNDGGLYCETMGVDQINELLAKLDLIDTNAECFEGIEGHTKLSIEKSQAWLKERAYEKLLQAQEQARIEEEKRQAQELAAFERQLNDIKMFAEPSHVGGRILKNMSSESMADLMSQLMRVQLSGIRVEELERNRLDVYKTLEYAKGLAEEREAKKVEDEGQYRLDKFYGMAEQANNLESRKNLESYEEACFNFRSIITLTDFFNSEEAKGIDEALRMKCLSALHEEADEVSSNIKVMEKKKEDEAQKKREAELEQAKQEERQRMEQEEASKKAKYKSDNEKLMQVRLDVMQALMNSNEQVKNALQQDPIYSQKPDLNKERYVQSKMITEAEASAAATALVKCLKFGIELPHIEIKVK